MPSGVNLQRIGYARRQAGPFAGRLLAVAERYRRDVQDRAVERGLKRATDAGAQQVGDRAAPDLGEGCLARVAEGGYLGGEALRLDRVCGVDHQQGGEAGGLGLDLLDLA